MARIFTLFLLAALSLTACKHYPIEDIADPDPDPDPVEGVPCDPEVVYFNAQVLPILISNCAMSGCHDAISKQDGVNLTSYQSVMSTADVDAGKPTKSKLYEVLVDDDPDDRMPRPPAAPLSQEQINLIATWIQQGAKNLECDPDAGGCNTDGVTYSAYVKPLLQTYCTGCHSPGGVYGTINLSAYSGVKDVAQSGKLYGAIAHQTGYSPMPQGGGKLGDCQIEKIKAWIDAGAPEN